MMNNNNIATTVQQKTSQIQYCIVAGLIDDSVMRSAISDHVVGTVVQQDIKHNMQRKDRFAGPMSSVLLNAHS